MISESFISKGLISTKISHNGSNLSQIPLKEFTYLRCMDQVFLNHLEMIQFKNHSNTKLDLQGRLVCIIGDNGMGKTNLLDAVYVLSMCKSYVSYKQADIIQEDQSFVRLVGQFQKGDQPMEVVLKYPRRGKKTFTKDGKAYKKLKEHIGTLPVVIITPDDVKLLLGGSADRRAFVDNTICQIDSQYLDALTIYKHILKQKSSLLKSGQVNFEMLDIYDQQLSEHGLVIHQRRQAFFTAFSPVVAQYYGQIADHKESVKVRYASQINDVPLDQLLKDNRSKEVIVQRCLYGTHKDDMELLMSDKPVKGYASQGQRKSLLLSLKIAQFDFIRAKLKVSPLILLDDLFDKLDHHRVRKLIELLTEGDFGQIFITDTSRSRVADAIANVDIKTDWLTIKNGAIQNIDAQ